MDSSLVKIDNVIAWNGIQIPFMESYSLILSDQNSHWSLCLKFSFDVIDAQSPRVGCVEAIFQDTREGQICYLKQEYNLDQHDIVHADKFVDIGDCHLSLADSFGALQDDKNTLKWECVFEDPVLSFRPYPDVFYPFSFPRFKMTYPRFLNFARGQFFLNHKKYEFSRVRVHQNHGYGRLQPHYFMVNALGFAEDSDAVLSLFAPRFISKIGTCPDFPCVILSMEGMVFVHQPLYQFLFNRHLVVQDQGFSYQFYKRPYRFLIEGTQDPKYNFTTHDGSALNLLAKIQIDVQKKSQRRWQTYKVLTSNLPVFVQRHVAQSEKAG